MAIQKGTYQDQVIDFMYDMILRGKLAPGEHVSEQWLSETLKISRAPIREAMRQLAKDGLITYRPQVGNSIAALSPKAIYDTYVTRGLLEGFAARCAMNNFTDKDFAKLDRLVEKMVECAREGQHFLLSSTDKKFHEFIFNKSENRQLIEFAQTLSMRLHLIFCKHWTKVYIPEQVRARHQLIVDHIRAGNPVAVEECIRTHYEETGKKMMQFGTDVAGRKD